MTTPVQPLRPIKDALDLVWVSLVGAAMIAGGFIPSMGILELAETSAEDRYGHVLACGWLSGMAALYTLLPIFRGVTWLCARWYPAPQTFGESNFGA